MARRKEDDETKRRSAIRSRILLVDDHPLVREGLATLIRATPDLAVAGEASSAEEACQKLSEDQPDLAMIDLSLPGMGGIDLIKLVRERYPRVRVLVLSMHEENIYAERVLRAGAHGYIMKQAPGSKIIEAVRIVLRGEVYVSPAIAARLLQLIVDGDNGACRRSSIEGLSNRELQVFTSIGMCMATQEIADQLHLSVKTIQTYREHIKRKLALRNSTDLIHYAAQWFQSQGE
jgi:DNA-binding NarL/FixJ family response regulator